MTELDADLVDRALSLATKRSANLDYFFDKLSSADWVKPLRDRGLFSSPPDQFVDEQGYVRAPQWSASRYLARVAPLAPDDVVDAISSIATSNERIHEDFVDAALRLPTPQAVLIAALETQWLGDQDFLYYALPDRLVALGVRLLNDGESGAAESLAVALFAVHSLPDGASRLSRVETKFRASDYDQLLSELVTKMISQSAERTMTMLMSVFGNALDILREDSTDEAFDALSRIWRPRIGQADSRSDDVQGTLVSIVRDAAVQVRRDDLLADDRVVNILIARREELLRRIAMYALAQDPEPSLELVEPWIMNMAEFASDEPSVEYRLLTAKNASRLAQPDLRDLLEVIERGPDLAEYRERAAQYGFEPSEEQVADHVAWWQAARLKLLESGLDREWLAKYQHLRASVGDAEFPTSGVVVTSWGPTSPLSVDELGAMSDLELIETLHLWRPPDSWMGPSAEGLGRTLQELTRRDPSRVATLLEGFDGLRHEYIEHTLRGFREALGDQVAFDWERVVGLVCRIADQFTDLSEPENGGAASVMRREAMALVDAGLQSEEHGPSTDLSHSIWDAIRQIAKDPEPSPEYEERYGGANMDPVMLSLNTTRPTAIRTAVTYAIWLKRSATGQDESPATSGWLTGGAAAVGDLLVECLRNDPSVATRAVIGQRFANIFALDRSWATSQSGDVFPHDDTPLREAAWGSYVIYSAPYNELLETLRSIYDRSAELAGSQGHGFRWMNGEPRSRLGEHLMVFYWRAVLDLDDPLLTTFWRLAPSQVRTDALTSVGRATAELDELADSQRQLVAALWRFAVENRSEDGGSELGAFAWWFSSADLAPAWRLEQLLELLGFGVRPDPGFMVMRELPSLAAFEPRLAVRALRSLFERESEAAIYRSYRDASAVLASALASQDPEAQRLAEETVNWLGALGYREYRSLLVVQNE